MLTSVTRVGGRPLSYVLRESVAVPASATDPMYTVVDSNYISICNEVIRRAAHTGSIYNADNTSIQLGL